MSAYLPVYLPVCSTVYIFCDIADTTEFGPGWDWESQPSDLWANHEAILQKRAVRV